MLIFKIIKFPVMFSDKIDLFFYNNLRPIFLYYIVHEKGLN